MKKNNQMSRIQIQVHVQKLLKFQKPLFSLSSLQDMNTCKFMNNSLGKAFGRVSVIL